MQPPSSRRDSLADKWGPKKTMNIAIWVFTLVTFITGYVRTFWQFIFLRLGLALGEGHHYVPAVRSIANFFPSAERGRANAAPSPPRGPWRPPSCPSW